MSNGSPQQRFNRNAFKSKSKKNKEVSFNNPVKDMDKSLLALDKALSSSNPKEELNKFLSLQAKKNSRNDLNTLIGNKAFKSVNNLMEYLEKITKTDGQKPVYDVINDIINNGKNADLPSSLINEAQIISETLTTKRSELSQNQKNLRNDLYNSFDVLNVIDQNIQPKNNIKDSKALMKLVKIAMESDWVSENGPKTDNFIENSGKDVAYQAVEDLILKKLDSKNVFDYSSVESKYSVKLAESVVAPFFNNEKFSKLFKELKKDYINSTDFNSLSFIEPILSDSEYLLSFKDIAENVDYDKETLMSVYADPTELKDTAGGLNHLIKYLDFQASNLERFLKQKYQPPKLKNKIETNILNILDEISNNLNMMNFENKEKLLSNPLSNDILNSSSLTDPLNDLKEVLERLEIKKSLSLNKSIDYLNLEISEFDLL